jgi:hypothetical protein
MLVTFKTKGYADITMFGEVALRLIGLMGHSGSIPGALAADDLPEAIRRLRAAADTDKHDSADASTADDDEKEFGEQRVSLANRALPLIELLESAEQNQTPVMWNN